MGPLRRVGHVISRRQVVSGASRGHGLPLLCPCILTENGVDSAQ